MKIAVLSGKGGTGKTFISVNLAATAKKSYYLDCDVEEPNGHLFFKPQDLNVREIIVKVPKVQEAICAGCKDCINFCKFNSLAYVSGRLKIFEDICHSCGGCSLICKANAIGQKDKVIGKIESGFSENVNVITGILNTGLASGVPIIKEMLKAKFDIDSTVFIDCAPGSACVVMESIKASDYCILVAEPTIFGIHNLNMVYRLVALFNKPCGVIINKYFEKDNPAEEFCSSKGINILERIPFEKELGKLISNAEIAVRVNDKQKQLFNDILAKVYSEVLK